MTPRSILTVALLCATASVWAAAPPVPWSEEQKAKLAERKRLDDSLPALLARRDYDRAVAARERIAELALDLYGEADARAISPLEKLAALCETAGLFGRAVEARERTLLARRRVFGERHFETTNARLMRDDAVRASKMTAAERERLAQARSWDAEARRLRAQGKARDALAVAAKAVAEYEAVVGEKDHSCDHAANLLASLHESSGDLPKALPLRKRSVAVWKAIDARHPNHSAALNALALLYYRAGAFAAAVPYFEGSLEVERAVWGEGHLRTAASQINLAATYRAVGQHPKALPLLRQAAATRERELGPADPAFAEALLRLGSVHQDAGDHAAALPLMRRASDVLRAARGEGHRDYATSLNDLALLLSDMGEHAQALPLAEKALAAYARSVGEGHENYADCQRNLALVYRNLGDGAKVLPLLVGAIKTYERTVGKRHPSYASALNDLAHHYDRAGRYDTSLPLYRKAAEVVREARGERHPEYAAGLNNLASGYLSAGQPEKALPLLQEAGALYKGLHGEKHLAYAMNRHNVGVLHEKAGEYDAALPLFRSSAEAVRSVLGERHPRHAVMLERLALLHQARGEAAEASKHAVAAAAISDAYLDDGFDLLGERQRHQTLQASLRYLSVLMSLQRDAKESAARRYGPVLAWKGRVAARGSLDRLALDDPDSKDDLARLREVEARLTRLVLASPKQTQQAEWVRQARELTEQKEALEAGLSRRSAAFRSRGERLALTPRRLAESLPDGVAFIDFVEYHHYSPPKAGKGEHLIESRLLAFVSRKGEEVVAVELGGAKAVADEVARWREAVQAPPAAAARATLAASALALRQRVWAALAKHVAGAEAVVVAPDGALCQFPFAALPGDREGTYLIEAVAVAHVASATQLAESLRPAGRGKQGKGLLAVGGIDYGRGKTYDGLPGTGPEAARCREAFREAFRETATLLTGKAASPAAVREAVAARPRHLHLATHGYFEPAERVGQLLAKPQDDRGGYLSWQRTAALANLPGLRCGLALSGANESPNVLTGQDVEGMDLRGCEVAVLSACQTALGDVRRTQGVVGLQRALHAAGVRTTVTSLWCVQDAATAELMDEFYKNLWGEKKVTRLEALRQAQLTILRDPERVRKRGEALLADARKRGLSEEALRGVKGRLATDLPEGGKAEDAPKTSPEAWWAAFVLCGDWR